MRNTRVSWLYVDGYNNSDACLIQRNGIQRKDEPSSYRIPLGHEHRRNSPSLLSVPLIGIIYMPFILLLAHNSRYCHVVLLLLLWCEPTTEHFGDMLNVASIYQVSFYSGDSRWLVSIVGGVWARRSGSWGSRWLTSAALYYWLNPLGSFFFSVLLCFVSLSPCLLPSVLRLYVNIYLIHYNLPPTPPPPLWTLHPLLSLVVRPIGYTYFINWCISFHCCQILSPSKTSFRAHRLTSPCWPWGLVQATL